MKLFIIRWLVSRTIARLLRHLTNIRFGKEFQTVADNLGAQMVAFFGIQFLLRAFLQMRRLRVDEQFVDRQALVFRKCAQDPYRV